MPTSYFDYSQDNVDELIKSTVMDASYTHIFEIGCGGKSAVTFGELLRTGAIGFYLGTNIDTPEGRRGVEEARAQGLTAKVVELNHDYAHDFTEFKAKAKRDGVVVMFGLSEVAPEACHSYRELAEKIGIDSLSYP